MLIFNIYLMYFDYFKWCSLWCRISGITFSEAYFHFSSSSLFSPEDAVDWLLISRRTLMLIDFRTFRHWFAAVGFAFFSIFSVDFPSSGASGNISAAFRCFFPSWFYRLLLDFSSPLPWKMIDFSSLHFSGWCISIAFMCSWWGGGHISFIFLLFISFLRCRCEMPIIDEDVIIFIFFASMCVSRFFFIIVNISIIFFFLISFHDVIDYFLHYFLLSIISWWFLSPIDWCWCWCRFDSSFFDGVSFIISIFIDASFRFLFLLGFSLRGIFDFIFRYYFVTFDVAYVAIDWLRWFSIFCDFSWNIGDFSLSAIAFFHDTSIFDAFIWFSP